VETSSLTRLDRRQTQLRDITLRIYEIIDRQQKQIRENEMIIASARSILDTQPKGRG
jgi:hypothetical protein